MKGVDNEGFASRVRRVGQAGTTNGRRRFRPGVLWAAGLVALVIFVGVALATYHPAGNDLPPSAATTGHAPAAEATTTTAAAAPQSDLFLAGGRSSADSKSANTAPAATGSSASTTTTSQAWDRMLIREASIQLSVKDVGAGADSLVSLAAAHGGRVLRMESHQNGDYTVSSVTLQVPSTEFDKILPQLRRLDGQVKKVLSESISSQDVTEEYTDLQSQLRNLQATEGRMLALQQKADKLEDILALDRELRQIQGQIEQITGRTNYLSKRSEMSQITVELSPEGVVEPNPAAGAQAWDPVQIASRAWEASLDLLARLGTVMISVVVFLWWLIPVALMVWLVWRRGGRRSSAAAPGGGEPSV